MSVLYRCEYYTVMGIEFFAFLGYLNLKDRGEYMTEIQEELKVINDAIKEVANFVQTDENVKPDFDEYIKTISGGKPHLINFQSACFNYIFERNIGEERKSIFELYLDGVKKIPAETKKVIKALQKSVSSVFEVKKVHRTGFELDNIINEKLYNVTSLVKMTSFRGIGPGQFVVARIFKYNKEHYLLEISGVLSSSKRDDALRFAVAKIIQNPELVYMDNPEKLKEIEKNVAKLYKDFVDYFGSYEVVTTNKFADDIIGLFNDYAETGEKREFADKIHEPETYRFFNVSEFNNSYSNFLENSLGGFSSHKEEYDVGILFDEELGLYAVPFYATFNKIFEAKDYSKIINYDKCIEYMLKNDKLSANLIRRVAAKHDNFMKVVNEVLKKDYTLDELLQAYKAPYLEQKIFSSTTVLYKSKAFSRTLGIIEEHEERPKIDTTGVGRNDPCPCGSGKKFKKCCGAPVLSN